MLRITAVYVFAYTRDNKEIVGIHDCDETEEYAHCISKEILMEAKENGFLNLELLSGGIAIPYENISYIKTETLKSEEV